MQTQTDPQTQTASTAAESNTSYLFSAHYEANSQQPIGPSARLFVGLAAATSALLGGLAAAWYYKKTLSRLQEAEFDPHNPKIGSSSQLDDEDL
ncbi:hypothetical protein DYQ86_19975 [Acidobacteria bacterium AB60]|nr:hypothetical protein DYQ86_19975 [Acidobacteria bacterium AB60]